jgi:hypothetical protein
MASLAEKRKIIDLKFLYKIVNVFFKLSGITQLSKF